MLRLTAAASLEDATSSPFVRRKRCSLSVDDVTVHVELLLLEGLPLPRSHVPVGQLHLRTLGAFVLQARGNDVDLRVEQRPDVPATMYLDGEKMACVVATLVGNALRYAHPSEEQPTFSSSWLASVSARRGAVGRIVKTPDNMR